MRRSSIVVLAFCAVVPSAKGYTTYIGDTNPYQVAAVATDAAGNTYVTGTRIVVAPPPGGSPPLTDVFVSKVDASGNLTLIATLSGKGSDQANAIAVDSAGNILVVGSTTSTDFPLHHPLQSVAALGGTGFLLKMSPDGTVLYSTYLGGTTGASTLNSVATDSKGDVYVTGETQADDYPRTPGLPAGYVATFSSSPISAAFFAKIASAGDRILYAGGISTTQHACGTGSSCFLSPIRTYAVSIKVDSAGNAYFAANTLGGGVAATPGAMRTSGIGAFVAKVNPAGTGLVYLTFLAAANYYPPPVAMSSAPGNFVNALDVDAAGNAYIAGRTSDPSFPATSGAFQPKFAGPIPSDPFLAPPSDAFVAKLNPTGSAVVWATFLGGDGADVAQTIVVDPAGNVWVSGTTNSSNFPVSSGGQAGAEFLAQLNSSGSALLYAARGPAESMAAAIAVDAASTVHTAGSTGLVSSFVQASAPAQTSTPRIFGIANAAGGHLAGRIAPSELISIYGLHLGPSAPLTAQFDERGFLPTSLGGVQVMIDGIPSPLLYISDTQINAVTPAKLISPGSHALQLIANGAALPDFRVVVDSAAPQVFGAVINQDGTINSQTNPAKTGSYVSVWATGAGLYYNVDGQIAASPAECGCVTVHSPYTNAYVPVSYSGAAPGTVNGVIQVNFQIATSQFQTVATQSAYYLTATGRNSDSFSLWVVN